MELTVRVLRQPPQPRADPSRPAKFLYMLRLYASHEVPGVRVRLRFGVRIGASRSWVVDAADAERGVGGAKGAAAKGTARGEWPLFSGGARGLGSGQPVAQRRLR